MIRIKEGVNVQGISPEMVLALMVVTRPFLNRSLPLVITSGNDSQHMQNSLHYSGKALDLRLPSWYTGVKGTDQTVTEEIKLALGSQYDVILESDHIHIEFDPPTMEANNA